MEPETTLKIPLSDQTVKRLKALAEPLEDTYDSVVSRLLDFFGKNGGDAGIETRQEARPTGRDCDPFAAPSLTHTKVTFASLEGEPLRAPNWNKLLDKTLSIAMERSNSFSAVKRVALVNLVEGAKANEGYHFLKDVGFSVQGQDANDAWRAVAHICRTLGLAAEVHFLWRVKEGATYPGSSGDFRIPRRA